MGFVVLMTVFVLMDINQQRYCHGVEFNKLCTWRHNMPPPALYAGHCGTDAAAQLQPIPYGCGAQHALLPIAVGAMNINELMNINDERETATVYLHAPAR